MWVFDLIGSLGLFLLGMWLMTEGLKQAGGKALQSLLGRWTSSRLRGLGAGMLVTTLVQSSSAITIATIGFVNAGLMTFQQSVWVIFGSNVGTTMTAWLVTLFGFNVDIEAFTFPLFGVGAFLRVFSPYKRGQAFGMALAGFGLLFMGIDALQSNFAGLAGQFDANLFAATGFSGALLGLGLGFMLTLITQSSSAAIAIILTAVASGIAGLEIAAAAVIGANIGTTSTALISTIAATANARRLALAHVLFNLITAAVAMLLLPIFSVLTAGVIDADSRASLTVFLALFHTTFNVLGVVLMWPIEPTMSRALAKMFNKGRTQTHSNTILDKNVAAIPDLAFRALSLELQDLRKLIGNISLDNLLNEDSKQLADRQFLEERLDSVDKFILLISQADLNPELSKLLTSGFSVSHYLKNSIDYQTSISARVENIESMDGSSRETLTRWLHSASEFTRAISDSDKNWQEQHWLDLRQSYQVFKNTILAAGVQKSAALESVESALLLGSLGRRYVEQMLQTVEPLNGLLDANSNLQGIASEAVENGAEEESSEHRVSGVTGQSGSEDLPNPQSGS